jgi:hypothetical protein
MMNAEDDAAKKDMDSEKEDKEVGPAITAGQFGSDLFH